MGWLADSADLSWAQWGSTTFLLASQMGIGWSKIILVKTTGLSHASTLISGSRVPRERKEQHKPS